MPCPRSHDAPEKATTQLFMQSGARILPRRPRNRLPRRTLTTALLPFLLVLWTTLCDVVSSRGRSASIGLITLVSAFHSPFTTKRLSSYGRDYVVEQYSTNSRIRKSGWLQDSSQRAAAIPSNQQQKTAAAHQYSSRQVSSRKTQLRWIAQTVQKIQARGNTTTTAENNSNNAIANTQLMRALVLLSAARTQQQVLEAGRLLEAADISHTQPVAIQERVVKAAAMTGLLRLALTLTEHMLQSNQYLPSEICQDAVCNSLRRAGRIQRLEKLLCQFGAVARAQNKQVSLVAFNTYLAALCDVVTEKDASMQRQRGDTMRLQLDASNDDARRRTFCLCRMFRTQHPIGRVRPTYHGFSCEG